MQLLSMVLDTSPNMQRIHVIQKKLKTYMSTQDIFDSNSEDIHTLYCTLSK